MKSNDSTSPQDKLLFNGIHKELDEVLLVRCRGFDKKYIVLSECDPGLIRIGYSSNPKQYLRLKYAAVKQATSAIYRVAIFKPCLNAIEIVKELIESEGSTLHKNSEWDSLINKVLEYSFQYKWTAAQLKEQAQRKEDARKWMDSLGAQLRQTQPHILEQKIELSEVEELIRYFHELAPFERKILIRCINTGAFIDLHDEERGKLTDKLINLFLVKSEAKTTEAKAEIEAEIWRLSNELGVPAGLTAAQQKISSEWGDLC